MISYLIAIGFGMFLLAVILECIEDVQDMRRTGKMKDFWARVMSWHRKAEYVVSALATAATYVLAFMVACATWPINWVISKPIRRWYKSAEADKAEEKGLGSTDSEAKTGETADKTGVANASSPATKGASV